MEQKDYILVRQLKYIVFFCFRKANSSLCYTDYKLNLSGTKQPGTSFEMSGISCKGDIKGEFCLILYEFK